jgi:Fe-S cluster assembly iron-binding protein IscA
VLQVTEGATTAVKAMLEESGVAPGGGLRIAVDEIEESVDLLLEDESDPDDTVIDQGGVKVFLDEAAAKALGDKILDAHGHDDHFHFEILEQEQS